VAVLHSNKVAPIVYSSYLDYRIYLSLLSPLRDSKTDELALPRQQHIRAMASLDKKASGRIANAQTTHRFDFLSFQTN
jgi:hypothetical protein